MGNVDVVRIDFALIPGDPLFTAVVMASQAITDKFRDNRNVIDDKRFPPHVSLHICTVPRDKIDHVVAGLRVLVEGAELPDVIPIGVGPAPGGYVMVNVERTAEIMGFHEAVIGLAAAARDGMDGDAYGNTYIRDCFIPHISLAKVAVGDLSRAAGIGRLAFGDSRAARARTIDLCDIGPRSERWNVMASVSPRARGGSGK